MTHFKVDLVRPRQAAVPPPSLPPLVQSTAGPTQHSSRSPGTRGPALPASPPHLCSPSLPHRRAEPSPPETGLFCAVIHLTNNRPRGCYCCRGNPSTPPSRIPPLYRLALPHSARQFGEAAAISPISEISGWWLRGVDSRKPRRW